MVEQESGFEDEPTPDKWVANSMTRPCLDPQHNPPGMLVVPPGKVYRHVCPSCKQVTRVRPAMRFGGF